MNVAFDHNKLLKKIAKERLKPFGIVQKGNSRSFFKDHRWYLIAIEFQPSGFSAGTYLNIGVDFNFYPRDFFAFAYGYREKNFIKAENEAQFAEVVNNYCDFAIKRVQELENNFADIRIGANTLKRSKPDDPWRNFDLSILFGLDDNLAMSARLLKSLIKEKCNHQYEVERKKTALDILSWTNDKSVFQTNVKNLITQTRQLKKIPQIPLDDITFITTAKSNNFIKSLLKLFRPG